MNTRLRSFEQVRRLAVACLATVAVCVGVSAAHADDDSYGDLQSYFKVDRLRIEPTSCVAEATINFDAVRAHMSAIRNAWLTQDQTTEFYQRHALEVIFGVIDHKAGGVLLEAVYREGRDKHPDKCHFALNLSKADDFGQVRSYPQLDWDFTAALASRIAWETFDDRALRKIALNYKFTPEADRLLKEEKGEQVPAPSASDRPRSCSDISASDVSEAFGNSPYAQRRHLHVLDATDPQPLPPRANRGFACISKLVTNAGVLNVLVEPKLVNGKWYVSEEPIPQ